MNSLTLEGFLKTKMSKKGEKRGRWYSLDVENISIASPEYVSSI